MTPAKQREWRKDWKALKHAIRWIETSTSDRMKRATAEFIYDRYVRHPSVNILERPAQACYEQWCVGSGAICDPDWARLTVPELEQCRQIVRVAWGAR